MLRAYRHDCLDAAYRLSRFGVDTVAVEDFHVARRSGRCAVAVTGTFRVVPQPPHSTAGGFCRSLRRRGTDVVAGGCTGTGLPTTISLTGRS
jgi:hypothetical protein